MFFHLGTQAVANLCITLAGQELEQVHKYKYLGFTFDDRLQFDLLFNDLYSRLNHLSYVLAKVRPHLTTKAAALVFKSKFLS